MDQIKISVVIPMYNRAKTIGYCLDSVLAQTYKPYEIILVDDCSNDDTKKVLQKYNDPKIRYLELKQRSGAQRARNQGILAAKGDWIAFQDSDDEWLPTKLEKQVQKLSEVNFDPLTVVHTNAIFRETATGRTLDNYIAVEGVNIYATLLQRIGPMFQGMLVSVKALQLINYLDERVPSYQEWDTSIRLAKHCRFIYIPEPLFIYHLHEGDTISKNKQLDYEGYKYVVMKFENEIKQYCGNAVWEEHLRAIERRRAAIT
ncbi:MAG TPA: glycosyltransferase family 2 protein [Bacillota bacterium]|jgi:glycosyltransferase involved in cell wall biosynthesis|nr:glycosyltransferase family 2 protein [Bacillota bacterium]HOL11208.1 glycosyltransferase family 2 protein [Bacillota bacterium]